MSFASELIDDDADDIVSFWFKKINNEVYEDIDLSLCRDCRRN